MEDGRWQMEDGRWKMEVPRIKFGVAEGGRGRNGFIGPSPG